MNHNTPEHMMYNYYPHRDPNLSKTLVSLMFPLFSTFMRTPTLNTYHKSRHDVICVVLTKGKGNIIPYVSQRIGFVNKVSIY
jgi:hypothetical protein